MTKDLATKARAIFEAIHAMGPGLTVNDRIVYIADCLAKAHAAGWKAGIQRSRNVTQAALDSLLQSPPE